MEVTLFFTNGMSLAHWERNGSIGREVALYRAMAERGVRVNFITYGSRADLELAKRFPEINVYCNRFGLNMILFKKLMPLLFAPVLRRSDVIKTNQMQGAEFALKCARFWNRPLVARCGYMWSLNAARAGNAEHAAIARDVERDAFAYAAAGVVTSDAMKAYLADQYDVDEGKLHVLPNYVTDAFFDVQRVDEAGARPRIVSVGRLSEEKNYHSLIEACAGKNVELVIAGEGPLGEELQHFAEGLGVDLTLPGTVPHEELPRLLSGAAVFALVSRYEGHPKSLIEAMASGASCLGTDVPGIASVIDHGRTGLLCEEGAASVGEGLDALLGNRELREELGIAARAFAERRYRLSGIVDRELSIYKQISQ